MQGPVSPRLYDVQRSCDPGFGLGNRRPSRAGGCQIGIALVTGFVVALAACAAPRVISFERDVYPILEDNCLECHSPPQGKGYRQSGLDLRTCQALMHGTLYGPVVRPGDPQRSVLLMLIEGRADPSLRMPHNKDKPLPAGQIAVIQRWIIQGAADN
jgi:hypothetical protein